MKFILFLFHSFFIDIKFSKQKCNLEKLKKNQEKYEKIFFIVNIYKFDLSPTRQTSSRPCHPWRRGVRRATWRGAWRGRWRRRWWWGRCCGTCCWRRRRRCGGRELTGRRSRRQGLKVEVTCLSLFVWLFALTCNEI